MGSAGHRSLFAQNNTNKHSAMCAAPTVTFVYVQMNCLYCPYSYRNAHLYCLYTPTAPVNLGLGQLARDPLIE